MNGQVNGRLPSYISVSVVSDERSDDITQVMGKKSKSDLNLNNSKKNLPGWQSLQSLEKPKILDFNEKRSIAVEEVVPIESELLSIDKKDDDSWKMNLTQFSSQRRGKRQEDKKLSKGIKRYYKEQDLLITTFEDYKENRFNEEEDIAPVIKKASNLAKLSFALNTLLLIGKTVAAAFTGSLAIITSVIDSVVDLVSGAFMWWSSRAIKKRDPYLYPQGRTKLEPIAIVVLSVVMALASVAMIQESVETIIEYAQYDMQNSTMHNETAVFCLTIKEMYEYVHLKGAKGPDFNIDSIVICIATIVVKFVLFIICRRCPAPVTQALAQDHRNDVLSNTGALAFGLIAAYAWKYADPIGAILISIYIIVSWYRTGREQIKLLTGHTAQPDFLKKLTWLALNHHEKILFIDTLRAFHFGNNFLVEVDIVLPGDMQIMEAHDIGESLQIKMEKIQEVERAFVHIDYEFEHHPNSEHKVV